jgi:hypothetical protein
VTAKNATSTDSRPILTRARDAMPGLTAADKALVEVRAAMMQAAKPVRVIDANAPIEAAVGALLDGKPIPVDLGEQLLAVDDAQRRIQAKLRGLSTIQEHLIARRQDIRREQVDAGLAVLADELEDVIAKARPVAAALGQIRDAQTAIDANLAPEWQTIRGLAARHAELRQAQLALVQDALQPSDSAASMDNGDREGRA